MKLIQYEGTWHIAESTAASGDTGYSFTSFCGITAPWDQTFIDQMPSGGASGACEDCQVAQGLIEKPKAKRKK